MPQNRDKAGRFPKGVSGNPGGRPKTATLSDLIHTVTANGKELVEFYWEVFTGQHPEITESRFRMEAAQWLTDRGWGKAPQHISVDVNHMREEAERIAKETGLNVEEVIAAAEEIVAANQK